MATIISKQTGDFTTAGTWGVVVSDTGAIQTTVTGTTNTNGTSTFSYSNTFTASGTGDAIALHCKRLTTTGTVSVTYNDGSTDVRIITVNASDLPLEFSWVLFKFGSTLALTGSTNKIGVTSTSAANAAFAFQTSTPNWCRLVRSTSTGAPASADIIYVLGEWTAAGAGSDFTVTMNNNNATIFGTLDIGQRGILDFPTAATSQLNTQNATIWGGAKLQMGTSSTRVGASFTARLLFDCSVDGQWGLTIKNGGRLDCYGAIRNFDRTLLASDAAASATNLTVADNISSGAFPWGNGDSIGIASTTRTAADCEQASISSTGSSTITISPGLVNAHSGSSPTQAEIVLLTRNVIIRPSAARVTASTTTTFATYINVAAGGVFNASWAEFSYIGDNTALKRGIEIETTAVGGSTSTAGSVLIDRCSIYKTEDWGVFITGSTVDNVTITNNVLFSLNEANQTSRHGVNVATTSGTAIVISGNCLIKTTGPTTHGFNLTDVGLTFNNNTAAGCSGDGFNFQPTTAQSLTFTGNVAHSNTLAGIHLVTSSSSVFGFTLTSHKSWRNSTSGVFFGSTSNIHTILTSLEAFGNATTNINLGISSDNLFDLHLISCTLSGDTTFSTPSGILCQGGVKLGCRLISCDLGTVTGIKTGHTTADIDVIGLSYIQMILDNTKLSSSTELSSGSQANFLNSFCFIRSNKLDQVAGKHKSWFKFGIIESDSSVFKSEAPSEKLTPNNATNIMESGLKRVAIRVNEAVIPRVWVRRTVAGNEIRMFLRRNDSVGITSDTQIASIQPAINTWEQLNGSGAFTIPTNDDGVLEMYVTTDNTNGIVYLDDWVIN